MHFLGKKCLCGRCSVLGKAQQNDSFLEIILLTQIFIYVSTTLIKKTDKNHFSLKTGKEGRTVYIKK